MLVFSFKKTKGMSALLEERRKQLHKRSNNGSAKESATAAPSGEERSLEKLVESVKRKTVDSHTQGQGKRRKL